MEPRRLLQRDGRELYDRIELFREAAPLLVNAEDNKMTRRIGKPRPQYVARTPQLALRNIVFGRHSGSFIRLPSSNGE